jgi:hypothetical protein
MKKFVVLIYNDATLLEALPQEDFNTTMRECIAYADSLHADAKLLDSQMLQSPASAKTLRVRGGKRTIVDGPFTETKEMLAGFNLIEAADMDEALRIAAHFPWAETGAVEVREVVDFNTVRQQVGAPMRSAERAAHAE